MPKVLIPVGHIPESIEWLRMFLFPKLFFNLLDVRMAFYASILFVSSFFIFLVRKKAFLPIMCIQSTILSLCSCDKESRERKGVVSEIRKFILSLFLEENGAS